MNCKAKVHDYFGVGFHQCTRKATKGSYCFQHHPDAVKRRRKESERKYQERMERDPLTQLMRCQKRCKKLEKVLRMFIESDEPTSHINRLRDEAKKEANTLLNER